jgi:hypothetical protein
MVPRITGAQTGVLASVGKTAATHLNWTVPSENHIRA